jgi:hypothetical protein
VEATQIFVENVDGFHRQQNLTKFRQYFPHRKGWVYPTYRQYDKAAVAFYMSGVEDDGDP